MTWALIIGGAAVVLVLGLVLWAVWLLHRAQDLWWQIRQLGGRFEKLAGLVEQLQVAPSDSNLRAARERTTHRGRAR